MENFECIARDYSTIPGELLADSKAHLRVEFTRDDTYITQAIARAISEVENVTNVTLFLSTWAWKPEEVCGNRFELLVPKAPLTDLTAVRDSTDVTAEFAVDGYDSTHEPGRSYVKSADGGSLNTEGVEFTITAGYSQASDLPPSMLNPILLITGELYERREMIDSVQTYDLTNFGRVLLSNVWRPTA